MPVPSKSSGAYTLKYANGKAQRALILPWNTDMTLLFFRKKLFFLFLVNIKMAVLIGVTFNHSNVQHQNFQEKAC